MIRLVSSVCLLLLFASNSFADEYLTFCIDGNHSGPGRIIITGNFDVDFGIDTHNGPCSPKRWGNIIIREVTQSEHTAHTFGNHNHKAVVIIDRKNNPQQSNVRFFVRFRNSSDNQYHVFEQGQIQFADIGPKRAIVY
jgi:hypothetical protein